MTQHTRTAFSRVREVLEHAIQYLTHIGALLDSACAKAHPERVRMLLESFQIDQRALLDALEKYTDDESDKVGGSFINFSIELPTQIPGPDEPLTTRSLTQWLLDLNQHLISLFEELAATAATAEAREALAALSRQVQAHDRRLSKEYQNLEDL